MTSARALDGKTVCERASSGSIFLELRVSPWMGLTWYVSCSGSQRARRKETKKYLPLAPFDAAHDEPKTPETESDLVQLSKQYVSPETNQGEKEEESMKLVEAYVAKKQAEFSRHAFFADQQLDSGLWGVLSFAPDLTFWVMAFQDILRLNAARTQDPQLRKIVRHHMAEDAGHERWFLDDLAAMQMPVPDVRWLFSKRHSPTRDAAYQLLSEVYRTNDDRMRLVLITTLESAGHVFFGRISEIVEKAGWTKALKYFSFSHLEV